MLGMIFLAIIGGVIGYMAYNVYSGGVGLGFGALTEPLTNTSLWTDWLTWSIGSLYGLFLLASMGFVLLVLIMNATSGRGDIIR